MGGVLSLVGCGDDTTESASNGGTGTATESGTGDGDGDTNETGTASQGDGDGDAGDGDGDGDPDAGDGDGDSGDGDGDGDSGDGDGDPGDGDGDSGDGDGDTGDGDGDTGDGDGDTGDGDGDTGDGVCANGCGTPDCGPCPDGPTPIDVGMYSIDSTEVTNEQYAAFLEVEFTQEYLAVLMPPSCSWKNDFTPDDWPDNMLDLPVMNVDWCDATAYCSWAGKRLCGAVGGGPAPMDSFQNPATHEWYRACTQGGIKNYPYGNLYSGMACNTIDSANNDRVPVGSLMTCVGGYPGIFDMSGNVWEWTNTCNDDINVPDNEQECRQHGGSYFSDGPTSRCGIDSVRPRDYRNINLGFRCCSPG